MAGAPSVPERGGEVLDDGGPETVEKVGFIDAVRFPELPYLVFAFGAGGDGGDGLVSDDAGVDPRLSMTPVPVEGLFGPREDVTLERLSRGIAEESGIFVEGNQ